MQPNTAYQVTQRGALLDSVEEAARHLAYATVLACQIAAVANPTTRAHLLREALWWSEIESKLRNWHNLQVEKERE